jgi:SnoaL-like domain
VSKELLLTAYERGWNLHDAGVCADCFAPDGIREMRLRRSRGVAAPAGPACGREAIHADIALVMEAVPDLVVEVLGAAYASDRRLWAEWRVTGTCTGERWGRARALDVLGVSVFHLSNSGFLEERLYWDSAFARSSGR